MKTKTERELALNHNIIYEICSDDYCYLGKARYISGDVYADTYELLDKPYKGTRITGPDIKTISAVASNNVAEDKS